MAEAARHNWLDDAQALATGTLLAALGVNLLGSAQLVTGGLVGLAFLICHGTGIGFGVLYVVLNLPFYALAIRKKGWPFAVKTFCAVGLLAALTDMMPLWLRVAGIAPLYAALAGGVLIGVGLLALFRHHASLGGFNILVLYLQEHFGWRAGWTQLLLDAGILLASIPVIGWQRTLVSLLAAFALNVALALNHRPGRYVAV